MDTMLPTGIDHAALGVPLTCAECGAEVVLPGGRRKDLFTPLGTFLRCSADPTHDHGCRLKSEE